MKGMKTGGREKGTLNKVTQDLRAIIEGALADAGGRKYLAQQAVENPAAFLSLVGKILPRDVNITAVIDYADMVLSAARRREGATLEAKPLPPTIN